jgi:hypothetical protein
MIAEEIRRLLNARPFKPFRLHLTDQAVHEVPQTDWALLNPAGTMMVVMDKAGCFDWLSTAHITRITHVGEPQGMAAQ